MNESRDYILSAEEMTTVDQETQRRFGIDAAILMENAGRGVAERLHERLSEGTVVCVAGPGHNGGDAMVVARHLHRSGRYRVHVVLLRDEVKELARIQLERLDALQVPHSSWSDDPAQVRRQLERADCIVDGISGTGLAGPLRTPAAELVSAIRAAGTPVLSIDVPSGSRIGMAEDDSIVHAHWTVATGNAKDVLYCARVRPAAGEITVVDPGFPPELVEEIGTRTRRVRFGATGGLRPIDVDAYKSRRGRVLVIGGSAGAAGAAILAGEAALHAGAGMVRILSEPDTVAAALVREPALLGEAIPARTEESRWDDLMRWADAIVLGPGWIGVSDDEIVSVCERAASGMLPVVADAAALRIPAERWESLDPRWLSERVVLTPHPGEMAGLLGSNRLVDTIAADPYGAIETFRARCPATVVLKDAVTIIGGSEFVVVDGREPALGTAGSGDVLSGVIGAYLAAKNAPERAAEEAVCVHLATGRRLAREVGWFSASELARGIRSNSRLADTGGDAT